jgi:hypothetical protein
MAAHSHFGGLFPQAGILLTAQSNQRAIAYCAAAEQDERAGFLLTAAFEWRCAAECFTYDSEAADRCWLNWERLMGLPRFFARVIDDSTARALAVDELPTPVLAA